MLREALSKLSKAQENVINDIIDICNECREKNQDRCVRKSMEEIAFIEDRFTEVQEQVEDYLEKMKYEESEFSTIEVTATQ